MSDIDVPVWLLSGKPVLRFQGRDYDQSNRKFMVAIKELCDEYSLKVAFLETKRVPGVIVQAYLDGEPVLEEPILRITKSKYPWLYCIAKDCSKRLAKGAAPGSTCPAHESE